MPFINLFPTTVYIEHNPRVADDYLPIAEEYLNKFGKKFSDKHEEYSPNHISTYNSQESINCISTDSRFNNLTIHLQNMARVFLDDQNVQHKDYKLHPFYLFNKIGKYSGHDIHSHPESIVSGCIYLKTTGEVPPIIFYDPRPVHKYYYYTPIFGRLSDTYKLLPEYSMPVYTGLIMMWNSWMEHEVPMSYDDSERITLAFNLSK